MSKRFLSIHTREAIEVQVDRAEEAMEEHGTAYPDHTFEDGVREALQWVLGQCAAPMEEAEGEYPRGQVVYDREAGESRYVTGSLVQHYPSCAAHATDDEASHDSRQCAAQSCPDGPSEPEGC